MHTPGKHTPGTSRQGRDPLQTDSTPCVPRRAYRHLRTRHRILPLLMGLTLATGLLISGVAYLGARFGSTNTAQDTLTAHAHTAKHVLTEQGASVALQGGNLIVSSATSAVPLVLDGDTTIVGAVHGLTGASATIYALRGSQFVAISASDQDALGATLPASAATALAGHSDYSGVVTQGGSDYVTGITPLMDGSGTLVGAIGVGRSLGDVLAPANLLGLSLVGVSVLATLLALLAGLRFSGTLSNAALVKLDDRLNDVAGNAADLEQMVRAQVSRAQRQERLARQINDCSRELNTLMDAVEQGQAALRESASEIWAGMSLPGQMLDPSTATRLARQSAIVAGRIGSATEDARERYRVLVCMMNQVIAEGRVLGDEGRTVEDRANRLRTSIERMEVALGAKVVGRQYDLPGHPFARRLRRPSHRLSGPHSGTASHPRSRRYPQPGQTGPHAVNLTSAGNPPALASGPGSLLGATHPRTPSGIYKLDIANALKLDPATPPVPGAPEAPGRWGAPSTTNPANPAPPILQWPGIPPGASSRPQAQMGSAGQLPATPPVQPGAGAGNTGSNGNNGSRPGSSPLWSQPGPRPASFPGGALPGLSFTSSGSAPISGGTSPRIPGAPLPSAQTPGQPPRHPAGPPPRPGAPLNGMGTVSGPGAPAPRTDWINGNRSTPSAGNGGHPQWPQPPSSTSGQQPDQPGQPGGQNAPHTEWLND